MLRLTNITKDYVLGENTVHALCGVDIEFRKNEFVAILGPSGCGKTTLLNIVGGLDRYTDGDLIINNVSTKDYKNGDWDTYRNHSVGFVFQSYNLIPHQSVLANVELALTLTGVPKAERVRRATAVLERVGLGEHLYKKPNQLSGGQMQRVAIARALVNDPDIILADEPTGALDSETSVQVMDVLREISGEKLIIMVTHNPELAEEYADRIVRLKDGRIISDTNPCPLSDKPSEKRRVKQKKPSMSFFTALTLSLNNLMTKKARTLLTAFAGSIGIIGIAAILALSTGVENYIASVEEGTLSSYPLTIQSESMDMTAFMTGLTGSMESKEEHDLDKVYSVSVMRDVVNTFTGGVTSNDLTAFKQFLDSGKSGIEDYVTDIAYSYSTPLNIYSADTSDGIIQVNPGQLMDKMGMINPMAQYSSAMSGMGMSMSVDVFSELVGDDEFLAKQYDVLAGKLPEAADELVFIVSKNNEVSDFMLYSLGMQDQDEVKGLVQKVMNNEALEWDDVSYTYEQLLELRFKLLPNTGLYEKNGDGVWVSIQENTMKMAAAVEAAPELKVVGVVRAAEGSTGASAGDTIGYTHALTEKLLDTVNNSEIVLEQKANPDVDIFSGIEFDAGEEEEAAPAISFSSMEELQAFAMNLPEQEQQELMGGIMQMQAAGMPEAQILAMVSEQINIAVETTDATYEGNLTKLGVADPDAPSAINIYPADFEAKDQIEAIIENYNNGVDEDSKINYTDYVGLLMKSVTTIINAISYVLIAFVSISLVVSSIMIGIITYISVLERTKEIGILRAMGASKRDVSRVFNAETIIVGFVAGLLGIGVTLLLCLPSGWLLREFAGIEAAAVLPADSAVILVCISVLLTFIAGLIPARVAAKKDPVVALRTE